MKKAASHQNTMLEGGQGFHSQTTTSQHLTAIHSQTMSSGHTNRNQQYASVGSTAKDPLVNKNAAIALLGSANNHNNNGNGSAFLAKTTMTSAAQKKGAVSKGANSMKKREELAGAMQQFSINSQSTESLKGVNQKSKKQMLMLQLLQNFQDFGSFKKKQDGVGSLKNASVSTKNLDSKSIMLLADGNMLQMGVPSTTQNNAGGAKQGTSQKPAHNKTISEGPLGRAGGGSRGKGQGNSQHTGAGISIDIDQVNTRNNEAAQTKSFLNSQRIPNLENRLNGLTVAQQNKIRAQASSKQEYDRSGSNMQDIQGSLKKLATQELVFSMGGPSTKKTSLQKGKQSVVQRSNMTPKLGIVGLGQSSNSATKAGKNQSNFAIYNNQTLQGGAQALFMQQPHQGVPGVSSHDSYVNQTTHTNKLGSSVQQEPKKSSAISQYASAARLMPQNSITVANNPAAQQTQQQVQTTVFHSAHGSTMMDPNVIQNLSMPQTAVQGSSRKNHRQSQINDQQHQARGTVQFDMDPANLIQQSGKGSIISGMSLHDMQVHSQQQQQQTQSQSKRRQQQSQHLMNIISGVTLNPNQAGNNATSQKPLAKTQSAFLETQEQLSNLHHQNAEMDRELATLNSKRKVTRLKDKKGSRNNTQSLLEHPSFKSKNSHQNTAKQTSKVNTQKLSFPKNAITKGKLINYEPSPRVMHQQAQQNQSHMSTQQIRSKSQKKKDLFANLIAEAQDSIIGKNTISGVPGGGVLSQQQSQTSQQLEKAKMKKMHSQSNLLMSNNSKNQGLVAKGDQSSQPKAKRLIFQGSQQQMVSTIAYDSTSSITTPQGLVAPGQPATTTSPPPRNLKKTMLNLTSNPSQITSKTTAQTKRVAQPPTCTSPYISTNMSKTQVVNNQSKSPQTTHRRSMMGNGQGKHQSTVSPQQRFKTNMTETSSQMRRVNSNAILNPAQLNFNPNPGFGLDQKVVVRRQQPQNASSALEPNATHKRSQKYLVINEVGTSAKQRHQTNSTIGENINSTTLQDYSEYQLSFRQDHPKSSVTPLDNILDDQFSARQMSECHSKSPEVYLSKLKNAGKSLHQSAQQEVPARKYKRKAQQSQDQLSENASKSGDRAQLLQIIQEQRRQIAKLERKAMASHIVKHLELEVGHQLEATNQMVHIDENKDGQLGPVSQGQQAVASNPTLMALDQLKKRMTAHVQKTQLVNQKLAYRVICLEQQLQGLTNGENDIDQQQIEQEGDAGDGSMEEQIVRC